MGSLIYNGGVTAFLRKENQTEIPFSAAADTDAARGTALVAAKTAATAGDTIYVAAGDYTITATLAKDGVNWWFAPGAVVTWANTSVGHIFGDNNTAMTFVVDGFGTFIKNAVTNSSTNWHSSVLTLQHNSSSVVFRANKTVLNIAEGSDLSVYLACIAHRPGTTGTGRLSLFIDRLELNVTGTCDLDYCAGVWWKSNPLYAEIGEMVGSIGSAGESDLRLIFSDVSGSNATDAWFNVGSMSVTGGNLSTNHHDGTPNGCNLICVGSGGTDSTSGVWINVHRVDGNVLVAGDNKTYITAQKIQGSVYQSSATSKLYLDAQKVGGAIDAASPYFNLTEGKSWVTVNQFEPSTNSQELYKVSGGTHYLTGQELTAMTAQDAVTVTGGTLNLLEGKITSDSGRLDLEQSGGTLNVSPNVRYDPTKTSGTITQVGPRIETIGVTVDGGGSVLTTGSKGFRRFAHNGTITKATLVADQSGSVVIDVKKSTYSGFPTTSSITASAKPTLSSAQKSEDATLTGWTKTITAGDVLEFNVDSATTITRATLLLDVMVT